MGLSLCLTEKSSVISDLFWLALSSGLLWIRIEPPPPSPEEAALYQTGHTADALLKRQSE